MQNQENQLIKKQIQRSSTIIGFLVLHKNFDKYAAQLFDKLHHPINISQIQALFKLDQNHLMIHIYVKDEEKVGCKFCQLLPQAHKQFSDHNLYEIQLHKIEKLQELNIKQEIQEVLQPNHNCQICCLDIPQSKMFFINGIIHNICLSCMDSYINFQIQNMKIEKISCPHCDLLLDPKLIPNLISAFTFERYKFLKKNILIRQNEELKWCPNPKCSVVVKINPKKQINRCNRCSTQICSKCNQKAHRNLSCEKALLQSTKNWQNFSNMQRCKRCQGLIQKNDGCNHMKCTVCRFEWCWLCGDEFSGVHFRRWNILGCPGLADKSRKDWSYQKIMAMRILLIFLLIILLPILLPAALIGSGPGMSIHFFRYYFYPTNFFTQILTILFGLVIGIIIDPFAWLAGIGYGLKLLIQKLKQCKRRSRQKRQKNSFITQKIIQQQTIVVDQLNG